jgi:hypothetical protein
VDPKLLQLHGRGHLDFTTLSRESQIALGEGGGDLLAMLVAAAGGNHDGERE